MARVTVDLLYDRPRPLYATRGLPPRPILTDNGREFCSREEAHPYELLSEDDCFRVAGRTTWSVEIEEIQQDFDQFPGYYNLWPMAHTPRLPARGTHASAVPSGGAQRHRVAAVHRR